MRKTIYAAAGAVLVIGIAAPGWAFAAGPTTVEVTSLATAPPTGPNQFVAINQSGATGDVSLVSGPATPPLGAGSLQMSVSGSTDHWSVYNYDHDGAALSAITALSYSTYTDNTTTAPALQLEINPGQPASSCTACVSGVSYSTLNFEPYQNAAQGPLVANTWQSWNVLAGNVYGTHLGMGFGPGISWSDFVADYPNATIIGGFGVNVGSGWSAMTGNADALTIGTAAGTTVYNFEPTVTVSGKNDCLKGGWQTSNSPTFKNQGDCVSYFTANSHSGH